MRTVLNVIWFLFAGLWLAIGYVIAGILCCLPIITIPFGLASFRMASYVVWPFGSAVIPKPNAGAGSMLLNVIWFLLCGWWLVLGHVFAAIVQAVTIIGIVNAVVSLKMIPITCFPFGKQIVNRDFLLPHQRPLHSI
ncbi:YccF domain-containing protein [Arachnia propionica]|uniref:YccF domain-containing protein n=1 Tax=Arachnia propionica TaxID=1750 RepID=A0A3P1TB93_9ACTN|nr:YccF domain-containing protein [Arachnia propionica]RRD06707.1 YccF domain-containing protein [Arachnia propionica]